VTGPSVDRITADELPVEFGRYTLRRVLGEGGMGRVFDAELAGPSGFRKRAALKVIREAVASRSAKLASELGREARIGGLLRHPNIVDVYDHGVTDGQPWIAMELVDGLGLDVALDRCGALPPALVLELAVAIASGLARAHDLEIDGERVGLVHRDLKPSNVLLGRNGEVKVMDFGIARLARLDDDRTAEGIAKGTPAYMSPEQAEALEVDHRSDLFALGALLYELTLGERLLGGQSLIELMMQLIGIDERVSDPALLAPLDALVPGLGAVTARCLRRDPSERFDSAEELAAALRALRYGVPPAPPLAGFVQDLLAGGDGKVTAAFELGSLTLSSTVGGGTLPTNLTVDPTSFVGRARELEAIGDAVRGGARLVSLLGPGGTGKTRLARRLGLQLVEALRPGGVWFADLSPCDDAGPVIGAIAATLGVPIRDPDRLELSAPQLGNALASRGRLLLILDNFEQVVRHAPLLQRWLDDAPLLQILVTSRERLRLEAEQAFELDPLSDDEATELFVSRATSARPGFTIGDHGPAVLEIVRRLDRIPLAIELAAARAAVLSPDRLLQRLAQRFKLLRRGKRGASARQATLEGAIAWSWDLLEPWEQSALAQCALFRGGFTLEEAERLLDLARWPEAPWELDVLAALRDKSLLRNLPDPDVGEELFGMYESVRQFATARLPEVTDADAAARSWGDAVLEGLRGITPGNPETEQADVRSRLRRHRGNLEAILERFAESDPDRASAAAVALAAWCRIYGTPHQEQAFVQRAGATRPAVAADLRARALTSLGYASRTTGRAAEALGFTRAAVVAADETGDPLLAARTRRALFFVLAQVGEMAEAAAVVDDLLERFDALGSPADVGAALFARAELFAWTEPVDLPAAEAAFREAIDALEAAGWATYAGAAQANLGVLLAEEGHSERAEVCFRAALARYEQLRMRPSEALLLGNLGTLQVELGRHDDAAGDLRRALAIARETGHIQQQQMLLNNLALLEQLRGRLDRAMEFLQEGWRLAFSGELKHRADNRMWMGAILHELGRLADARACYDLAAHDFGEERRDRQRRRLMTLQAALAADAGDLPGAERLLDEALRLIGEHHDQVGHGAVTVAGGHLDLARAAAARAAGEADDAATLRDMAETRLEVSGDRSPRLVQVAQRLLRRAVQRFDEA